MPRRPLVLAALLTTLALTACENTYPPRPEVWADPSIPPYKKRTTLPEATDEGATPEGSLLASYAERTPRPEEELETWMLPFQAKTMIVELLIAAAKDDPDRMHVLVADNARWGMPDRRELRARPIFSHADPHGVEFLTAFRNATSRFGKKASFSCTPLQPGWQTFASSGAEPVWCMYTSQDGLDIIGFRLIMIGDRVKTDYVGFFPDRQSQAMRVSPGAGDPPPLTPLPKRPVDLSPPELMPDGSNPVLEKAKSTDSDAPIPVPAGR